MSEALTVKADDRWRLIQASKNCRAYAELFEGEELLLVGAAPETIIISKSGATGDVTIEVPRAVMAWVMFQCELAAGKICIVKPEGA